MTIYNKKLKLKYVKLVDKGDSSISEVAKDLEIPKQTLARWVKLHKRFGPTALENKRAGVKQKPINESIEKIVLDAWQKGKKSVYSMRKEIKKIFKKNEDNVSERQIQRIYKKHRL